jgi:hypothetical protein
MVDNNLHEQREVTEKILNYYCEEEVKEGGTDPSQNQTDNILNQAAAQRMAATADSN